MTNFRNARTALLAALLLLVLAPVSLAAKGTGDGGIGATGDPAEESKGAPTSSSSGTFPVRGPHQYGDSLGAGRNHQGQDLIAKCGKPVVAAVAGRVRFEDYQASGAGNYLVIKSKGFDHVYMHLLSEARVSVGDRVDAGEALGRVGTTGSSSTCHLHFEMWAKPGWYRGGSVINPTPHLKRWDS